MHSLRGSPWLPGTVREDFVKDSFSLMPPEFRQYLLRRAVLYSDEIVPRLSRNTGNIIPEAFEQNRAIPHKRGEKRQRYRRHPCGTVYSSGMSLRDGFGS